MATAAKRWTVEELRGDDDRPRAHQPAGGRFRRSCESSRCKALGTYAGVGMIVGLVGGATYGSSRTRHEPFRLYTVWLDAMGGMVAGAAAGAAVFWLREGLE